MWLFDDQPYQSDKAAALLQAIKPLINMPSASEAKPTNFGQNAVCRLQTDLGAATEETNLPQLRQLSLANP